jgi:hypothetical protein
MRDQQETGIRSPYHPDMDDLWTILLPLMVATAVLPLQVVVTILLVRSEGGRLAGFAWVVGMTTVRLAQGLVFGLILGTGMDATDGTDRPGPIESTLLLIVAVFFLVTAATKALRAPDPDAPPPQWMATIATVGPGRAFLAGAGLVALSPKLWAFTLAVIGAIAEADLGVAAAAGAFVVYAVGAVGVHLGILVGTVVAPRRTELALARVSAAIERYDRPIMIALSLVFGAWFLLKALDGFGVL